MPEKKNHYNYLIHTSYNSNSTNRFPEIFNSFIKNYIIFVNNSKRCVIIEILLEYLFKIRK